MKKKRYTARQLHNMKIRAIAGLVLSFVMLLASGAVLVAKYYAARSNKGVATASSLYFTSNYLRTVNGLEEADYPATYNTDAWSGDAAYDFDLEIRNYQNHLLYNDENLDITYKIEFKLIDTTDGGTYSVVYQDEQKTITDTVACEYEVTLNGGQAIANHFKISVKKPDGNDDINYKSVGILVKATPVSPGYMTNYGSLGGVLFAGIVSSQYELKGEFSKISDDLDRYTGFPYTVTYKPGASGSTKNIRITWDSGKLQMDKNCEYYYNIETSEADKKYIVLTIEPYAAFDIVFYRTDAFYAAPCPADVAALEQLVTITVEGGGTP